MFVSTNWREKYLSEAIFVVSSLGVIKPKLLMFRFPVETASLAAEVGAHHWRSAIATSNWWVR